jgi:hypothetical protein
MRKAVNVIELLSDSSLASRIATLVNSIIVYRDGKKLVRFYGKDIIVHPYMAVYSSAPIISLTPFVFRAGSKVVIYSPVTRHRLDIDLNNSENFDIVPFTSNGIAIISKSLPGAKVLTIDGKKGFEEHRLENAVYVIPQDLSSYVITADGTLYRASELLELEAEAKCEKVHYIENSRLRAAICMSKDNVITMVSDGVYGEYFELPKTRVPSVNGITQGFGSIALHSDGSTLILSFKNRKRFEHIVPYRIERPTQLYDNIFVGFVSENLAIYDASKEKLTITSFRECKQVKVSPQRGCIAVACKEFVALLNIDNYSYVVIPREADSVMLLDSYLILQRHTRLTIYELVEDDRTRLLIDIPTALTSCGEVDGSKVLCIDTLGRLVIASIESLIELEPQLLLLSSKEGEVTALIKFYTPGYPLKIVPGNNVHVAFQRYDSATTEISIKGEKNIPQKLSIELQGVVKKLETTVMLPGSDEPPGKIYIRRIPKLLLVNEVPLTCNSSAESSIKKCLKSLSQVSGGTASISILCIDSEARGKTEYKSILVENVEAINIKPIVNAKQGMICIDMLGKADADILLEAICRNGVTIKGLNCIEITDNCENPIIILTLRLRKENDTCTTSIPIRIDEAVAIIEQNTYEAIAKQKASYNIILPSKCIDVKSAEVVYDSGLKLRIMFENRCMNVAATVIGEGISILLEPNSRKLISIAIDAIDAVHGWKKLTAIEPAKIFVIKVPIPLQQILHTAHQAALKLLAVTGFRK